jgi:CheY-like chemotaxis protein
MRLFCRLPRFGPLRARIDPGEHPVAARIGPRLLAIQHGRLKMKCLKRDADSTGTLLVVGLTSDSDAAWKVAMDCFPAAHRAANCSEAVAVMQQRSPAVVICDDSLPDGSWRDVLDTAAALREPPAVVVTSRLANERLWAEVLNLGGYDLLARPLELTELRRSLSGARQQWLNARGRHYLARDVRNRSSISTW